MYRFLPIPVLISTLLFSSCAEDSGEVLWIDVRTPEEFATGHLEEAVLIPHTEIAARITELTENKDSEIHVYCRSGNRSGKAKVALEALGFTKVINEGGYQEILEKRQRE